MIKNSKTIESKYNACRSIIFQSENVRREKYDLDLEDCHYWWNLKNTKVTPNWKMKIINLAMLVGTNFYKSWTYFWS